MKLRVLLLLLAGTSRATLAQASEPRPSEPIVTVREAELLGGAAIGAGLLMSVDQRIGAWVRTSPLQRNQFMRGTMTGARLFGDPGTIVLGAALWAGGALAHDNVTATDGVRSLEAVALASAFTWAIKGVAGRARPYVSPGDAGSFKFGRGFGTNDSYQSFPSGHATAAFAFASAITARVSQRSPGRARWLGPLLYSAASLTGLSRMYDDKHWASDVLLGAGIGTVSGLLLSRRLDGR